MSESSQKLLLAQLEEAQETISRLSVAQVRASGLEVRLEAATRERDDLRQERDSEMLRAKTSGSHVAGLRERCGMSPLSCWCGRDLTCGVNLEKLQLEVNRLHSKLEQQKQSRTELSEEILRDARARLQMLQQSVSAFSHRTARLVLKSCRNLAILSQRRIRKSPS